MTLKKISNGGFANIDLIATQDDQIFIMKSPRKDTKKNCLAHIKNEIDILSILSKNNSACSNIVSMHSFSISPENAYIFFPYNIDTVPLTKAYLSPETDLQDRLCWLLGLARALNHLYTQKISHRDISPGNILVDRKNASNIKLCDFGTSHSHNVKKYSDPCGTAFYISVEQYRKGEACKDSDTWSMGMIFLQIITARRQYCLSCTDNSNSIKRKLDKHYKFNWPVKSQKSLKRLLVKTPQITTAISEALRVEPEDRISPNNLAKIIEQSVVKDNGTAATHLHR